jgi:glycosyltransferase involved in cell wall biosynthesis
LNKPLEFLPKKYLLSVSTIEPRKNYPFLLSVFKELSNRNPDLHWVIVGKIGWESPEFILELKSFAESSRRILVLDSVSDEDLVPIYDRASAFAFASHYEGFGIPLLEAMNLGLPAVVSDIPTFKEIGRSFVSYLPTTPESISKWVKAIEQAIASPKLNYDLSPFSWRTAAQTTAEKFQMAMKGKRESQRNYES